MKKLLLFILFPIITYGQVQIGEDIDGEAPGDQSGGKISISSDGTIIAIGARENTNNGNFAGHVRVFQNQNGNWEQIGQDIDGEAYEELGFSLSLSSNGNIIAIGVPFADLAGQVRVFENQNGNWTQVGQNINGEDLIFNNIGKAITLSSNGTIFAVSGSFTNNNDPSFGSKVRVFENQNGNWTQVGQEIENLGLHHDSTRIDLSSDGNIIAIASSDFITNLEAPGKVRVFENQNGDWAQIGQDIDGDNPGDNATRIDLSPDGNIIAIGSIANDDNGENTGQVRVFENQNGNWIQIGEDINGESPYNAIGKSVSISSNGNILATGTNIQSSGTTRIYKYEAENWIQIGEDINGEAPSDSSGHDVKISSNGSIVAIGSPLNDGNGENSGHVRVFDLSALLSTEEFTPSTFSLYPNPASTEVTIDIPQENTLEKITIYNNLGQLVLSSKQTNIETSTLSQGVYIIEVTTNQGTSSKKLIVE